MEFRIIKPVEMIFIVTLLLLLLNFTFLSSEENLQQI